MKKCNNSPFSDGNHKHVVNEDLQIIKNNVLRKNFIKRPKYGQLRPIKLEIAKCFVGRCLI